MGWPEPLLGGGRKSACGETEGERQKGEENGFSEARVGAEQPETQQQKRAARPPWAPSTLSGSGGENMWTRIHKKFSDVQAQGFLRPLLGPGEDCNRKIKTSLCFFFLR